MQTFLPYRSFALSAMSLDQKRLGKQRVEAYQLLLARFYPDYGWKSHPAYKMWADYPLSLAEYGLAVCDQWISRGYKDTLRDRFASFLVENSARKIEHPPWLGDEAFHRSHKSNLLRKDPDWYGRFHWDVPPDLPYIWPLEGVRNEQKVTP